MSQTGYGDSSIGEPIGDVMGRSLSFDSGINPKNDFRIVRRSTDQLINGKIVGTHPVKRESTPPNTW